MKKWTMEKEKEERKGRMSKKKNKKNTGMR